MAIYETIDRKRAEAKEMKNKSASMEELETPTASIKSFKMTEGGEGRAVAEPQVPGREARRHRSKSGGKARPAAADAAAGDLVGDGMAQFLKKALRIEVRS